MNDANSDSQPDAVSEALLQALARVQEHVSTMLQVHWDNWGHPHAERGEQEVIGAILARQTSLVTRFLSGSNLWNDDVAPPLLRTMVDGLITLAWILDKPADRSRTFVDYGLGQEKLRLEHHKNRLSTDGIDPTTDERTVEWESWLSGERYPFLTEVNIGNWAETTTRDMANQTGYGELYRSDYSQWSAATHTMWQFLVRFNLRICENPLHGFHRIPMVPELGIDPSYLQTAVEYLDECFARFRDSTGVDAQWATASDFLDKELRVVFPPTDSEQSSHN